jgi:hypothetical protein
VLGPVLLAVLFVVNLAASPGQWWVQWPALGIGILWLLSLLRVLWTIVMLGGVAAFVAYVAKPRG